MSEQLSEELKAEIRCSLEPGEYGCICFQVKVNGVNVDVTLDADLLRDRGVEFLSEIDLNVDNEWAVVCKAHGRIELPELDEDELEDDDSKKFPVFGFDVRGNCISGEIIFHVILDYQEGGSKPAFVYREYWPYSMLVNRSCLQYDFPVDALFVRFPTGHVIFG